MNGNGKVEVTPHMVAVAGLDGAVGSAVGVCLGIGTPAEQIMNLLVEHLARVLALVEPEQVRNAVLGEIRRNLPGVLHRHVEARMKTPGGVLLPGVGERVQ
jgi:hypothetical protein